MAAKKKTKRKAKPANNGKHPGGRPSKYKPEYPKMLMDYFNIEAGEQEKVENSKGQVCYVFKPAKLPTIAGFACLIDVCRDTINEWSRVYPEFSDSLKRAKDHQERILVENGLLGGYEKSFAIFTAKNLIDWRDKQEVDHSSKDGSMTPKGIDLSSLSTEDLQSLERITQNLTGSDK